MASPTRMSERSQKSLVGYVRHALEEHKKRNDVIDKMIQIDMAYACYKDFLTWNYYQDLLSNHKEN